MNSLQENLLDFLVMWINQDSRKYAGSERGLDLLTQDVLNTNKYGKLVYCDFNYWNEVLKRTNMEGHGWN